MALLLLVSSLLTHLNNKTRFLGESERREKTHTWNWTARMGTYRANFFKVIDMTPHQKRCWGHYEIQHVTRQNRHKSVLPLKRMKVQHKALSHERQQGPVRRKENNSLLSQNAGQDLKTTKCLQGVTSRTYSIYINMPSACKTVSQVLFSKR